MYTAILLSGAFRSYSKALALFLEQLPDTFHIFICYPKNSYDQYLNESNSIDSLYKNPRIKCIQIYEDPEFLTNIPISQREKNTFLQWYRIQKLFQEVDSNKYTTIIRIRPDIQFTCDIESFLAYFRTPLIEKTVYIPLGFDIFHSSFLQDNSVSVNDQIAFGTYLTMKSYCNMFNFLQGRETLHKYIISEELLHEYLKTCGIQIHRVDIPYTLLLSKCFTISICGDSASGKSSFAKLIQETLPFDKTLLFETDRYHKWERGAKEYQNFTHLHPEANHLEKLSTDAYKLRLGHDVFLVDYDHISGKFTEPEYVESKNFTIFCGLHTLYLDSLRSLMDLKIYMDTDPALKEFWKIKRDTQHRGTSEDTVRKTMALRQPDFHKFIEPQKQNANIWIQYSNICPANDETLILRVGIHIGLNVPGLTEKLTPFSHSILCEGNIIWILCNKAAKWENLTEAAQKEGYSLSSLKDSYHGILQYILILLTWKQTCRST